MWKKILYFLLVVILGFGVTMIAATTNFNIQSKELIGSYANKKEYHTVERFFAYAMPKEDQTFYTKDFQDGAHIEIYPCLVKHPYYGKSENGSLYTRFTTIEDSIAFTIFNLPSNFVSSDQQNKQGGIELTLSNNSTIFLSFDNSKKEKGELNYWINFYSYISFYYSLTVYINYEDYVDLGYSEDITFSSYKIFDGNENKKYQDTFVTSVGFNSELHNIFKEPIHNYHAYMMENGATVNVEIYEEKDRLLTIIENLVSTNKEKLDLKPSSNIIFSTDSFILTISITIAVYISLAIVITRIIFFRKKKG